MPGMDDAPSSTFTDIATLFSKLGISLGSGPISPKPAPKPEPSPTSSYEQRAAQRKADRERKAASESDG